MSQFSKYIACLVLGAVFTGHQTHMAFGQSIAHDIESLRETIETDGARYLEERPEDWVIECFNPAKRRALQLLEEKRCVAKHNCHHIQKSTPASEVSANPEPPAERFEIDPAEGKH